MPDKPRSVPPNIPYSVIASESLRIARASNNPESFSRAIKRFDLQGFPLKK